MPGPASLTIRICRYTCVKVDAFASSLLLYPSITCGPNQAVADPGCIDPDPDQPTKINKTNLNVKKYKRNIKVNISVKCYMLKEF